MIFRKSIFLLLLVFLFSPFVFAEEEQGNIVNISLGDSSSESSPDVSSLRVTFLLEKQQSDTVVLFHSTPFPVASVSLENASSCHLLPRKKATFLCVFRGETPEFQYGVSSSLISTTKNAKLLTFGKYGNTKEGFLSFFHQKDFSIPEEKKNEDPSSESSSKTENTLPTSTKTLSLPEPRSRVLVDPTTNILLAGTEKNMIGSFFFEPVNEPAVIEKLVVKINDVNTTGIFSDVPDDSEMVGTVSLWYQDGTPFLKENGEPAKSSALQSDGTVLFEGLQAIIPEAGERIFVGVDILPMVQSRSGSTIFATIPASSETRILGYWSQKEMLLSSNIPPKSNPSFFIFRSRLQVEKEADQSMTPLHSGDNELLKFTLSSEGDQEVFLRSLEVEISSFPNSGSDSFSVTGLRLLQGRKIIASRSGGNLTGMQTLTIGSCALGDSCQSSDGNRQEVQEPQSFLLEAEISSTGNFSPNASLEARIFMNGAEPGNDGFLWEDYGTGHNDGSMIRWVPRNDGLTEIHGEAGLSS